MSPVITISLATLKVVCESWCSFRYFFVATGIGMAAFIQIWVLYSLPLINVTKKMAA